jgi:hypothetical protein
MSGRDLSRRGAEALWEEATPVRVARRRGDLTTVLSVRLPRDILRALTLAARREGKGPGTLARELIERGLAEGGSASPARIARVLARLLTAPPVSEPTGHWTPLREPRLAGPPGQPSQSGANTAPAAKPIRPVVLARNGR